MSVNPTRTGKWEVRYREGRKNRGKTFSIKRDADAFDALQRVARQRGERIIRPQDTPFLDDFFGGWLERREAAGKADNTLFFNIATYEKHIAPYLGHLRVADLSPRRLDEWQTGRITDQASPYMLNRAAELLGQLLKDAKRTGLVEDASVDLPTLAHDTREGQAITPERVEAIRGYFLAKKRPGYAAMISVLAYVGVRPQELRKLQWAFLDGRRFLLDRKTTKTKRPRYLEIPAPVLSDLAQWRLTNGSPEGLIFPRTDGMEWRKTDWDNWRARWFGPAVESAGITGDFVPYDLRHTCASLMIRSGAPPAEVAEHMGHGLGVLFSTYAHMIEEMRGKPAEPIEAAILRARGSDVRRAFGERTG